MSFGAFMGGVMQGAQFAQGTKAAYAKQKILDIEAKKAEDDEKQRVGDKSEDDKINATVKDEIKAARGRDSASSGVVPAQPVAAPNVSPADIAGQGVQAEAAPLPAGTPPIAPEEAASPAASAAPVTPAIPAQPDAPSIPTPSMATPGINPALQGVKAEPPAAEEPPVQKQDKITIKGIGSTSDPHYVYSRKVELAMDAGNTRLAERYRNEWYKAVDTELKTDEGRYKKELLPKLHEIAKLEADGKLETLPLEQKNRLLKAQQEGAEIMAKHAAYGFKLFGNPLTRDKGLEVFSNSPLILGKHKVTDIKVMDGNLIPIGENGQPIMNGDKPVMFPQAAAEQLVAEHFPGPKRETKVVPKDSKLVQEGQKRGEWTEVATGKDSPTKPAKTDAAISANVREANGYVDRALGIQRDNLGNMMAGTTPEMVKASAEVQQRAAKLIRGGMDPEDAAAQAVKEHKAKAEKGPEPVDWKKYAGQKK